jgi:hypothetical protein
MFFAFFAVKVFHYSLRVKEKILTAKVAKRNRKAREVMNPVELSHRGKDNYDDFRNKASDSPCFPSSVHPGRLVLPVISRAPRS